MGKVYWKEEAEIDDQDPDRPRFLGYTLDAEGVPTFEYEVAGVRHTAHYEATGDGACIVETIVPAGASPIQRTLRPK